MGRTNQKLGDRIKQHVTCVIRNKTQSSHQPPDRRCRSIHFIGCDSAVGKHLLFNKSSAETYSDGNFRILYKCLSAIQLKVMEALSIKASFHIIADDRCWSPAIMSDRQRLDGNTFQRSSDRERSPAIAIADDRWDKKCSISAIVSDPQRSSAIIWKQNSAIQRSKRSQNASFSVDIVTFRHLSSIDHVLRR